jgi:hypothetical protein
MNTDEITARLAPEVERRTVDLPVLSRNAAEILRVARDADMDFNAVVRLAEADGRVTLEVEDRGPGIDPEDARRIFERFFRGRSAQHTKARGTGIGLSTTRMLVQRAGGRIEVESAPGAGSTFRVILPRSEASPRPSRVTLPQGRRDADGAPCLVAVIDPELRQACVRALRGVGFTVHEAGTAEAAMRINAALGAALRFILCEELMHHASAPA